MLKILLRSLVTCHYTYMYHSTSTFSWNIRSIDIRIYAPWSTRESESWTSAVFPAFLHDRDGPSAGSSVATRRGCHRVQRCGYCLCECGAATCTDCRCTRACVSIRGHNARQ